MADEKDTKLFQQAMDRWDLAVQATEDQRALGIEDKSFHTVPGAMWEESVRNAFQEANKPRYEINKITPVLDALKGEQKQIEISVKYRPAGGGATPDVAKTLNGLFRNIESQSNFKMAVDVAFDEMVDSGWGGWRIKTREDECDIFEDKANQEIVLEPIYDAVSRLYFDPSAVKDTKEDAKWAFLSDLISKEEFETRWPDFTPTDWDDPIWRQNWCKGWHDDGRIRVAEYWRKVKTKKTLVKLSDGRVFDKRKVESVLDELEATGITVAKEKEIDAWKVEMFILSGGDVLEGPFEWAGSHIPLIPGYADRAIIQGKEYIRGPSRNAKDPSRINNYSVSATVEVSALAPKSKLMMTKEQAQGLFKELATLNHSSKPVGFYNHVQGQPAPFPIQGPNVPAALVQVTQQATQDIISSMGAPAQATAPRPDNEADTRSGIAIIEANRAGQSQNFGIFNSLVTMYEYTAKQLAELMGAIYDAERQVRIINPDGTEEFVTINETIIDEETGEQVILQDLTQGKYDWTVDTGPAYASQRVEAVNRLLALTQDDPNLRQEAMDIIVKNSDVPGAEELHGRIRSRMIRGGQVAPTPEEIEELGLDQPQPPSQVEQLAMAKEMGAVDVLNAEAQRLTAQAQKEQAQALKLVEEAKAAQAKAANTDMDTYSKAIEAEGTQLDNIDKTAEMGLPLTMQDHDNRVGAKDIVEEAQEQISPGLTSEQAARLITE